MKYIILYISLIKLCFERKWSIEDLIPNIKEWNYLNDPEELITDKNLGPKIHSSYLVINRVYEKTDINLFYLSDVIEKYVYHRKQFVIDLCEAMLNSTDIPKTGMKKHHLFLVLFKKYNEVIIYGSSPELRRLLPDEKVKIIELEMKKAFEKNKNNPAQVVYILFDKLQQLWKRFTIDFQNPRRKPMSKTLSNIKDIFYLIGSTFIIGLFIYVFCCMKKTKDKND